MNLADKVAEENLASLPDWSVAEILNSPDSSFPEIVTIKERYVGPGTIMETLGPDAGAAFLDSLETLSATVPSLKWAMVLVKNEGVNVGSPVVRDQLDQLVTIGVLTTQQATSLKSLGEVRRFPSWAEYHNVTVTARTVGLARGGI